MFRNDQVCQEVDFEAELGIAPSAWYPPIKTAAEWMVALMMLLATAPLLVVMAAATKLTSAGPAFYQQTRLGRRGRPFVMYKIRTMQCDSETKTGAIWSGRSDARVTRLGRFLRDTHLDELPQLWNVLRGEMSIVGPRPERPELAARIERAMPMYRQRLAVRPGLTGLAQVQRPSDVDLEDVRQKLVFDIYYVRRLSASLDMRIVLCTALHMMGLLLNATGKVLVRSCGVEAERSLDGVVSIIDRDQRVGAA